MILLLGSTRNHSFVKWLPIIFELCSIGYAPTMQVERHNFVETVEHVLSLCFPVFSHRH